MAGPWEDYQQKEAGPWSEYQAQEPVKPNTIQEMHPSFTTADRLMIKNLSNSPEVGVNYLTKKHPGMEITFEDGQYKGRAKGENDYRVLDPDTGFFSSDFARDVGDLAFDIPAGLVEGGATALGALGGAFVGGGVGALPGAMLASAATTAGNEAIRQKLGQALGLDQNVDMTDVAVAGGIGAVSPMLFGAGKARGAFKTAWDGTKKYVAPKIGQAMSGVPGQVLRNYSDDATRETVDSLSKTGVDEYTGKVFGKIKNYVEVNVDDAGKGLVQAIDETGQLVNVRPAKEAFSSKVEKLAMDPNQTNSDAIKVEQLKNNLSKYFGRPASDVGPTKPFVDDAIPAGKAFSIQKDLKQTAKYGSDMSPEDLYTKGAARDSYSAINNAFDEASGGAIPEAKKRYKDAIQVEQEILPKFEGKTPLDSAQKTYTNLSNIDTNGKKILKERLKALANKPEDALDIANEIDALSTYKWLGNTSLNPFSSAGTTSTSRTIPLAIAGGSLGSLYGYNQGGGYAGAMGGAGGALAGTLLGSPAAMKAYIKAHRMLSKGRKSLIPNDTTRRAVRNGFWTEMLKDGYIPDEAPQE